MNPPTRFAELRRAKGLTQKQLAEKLGVSTLTVYRWEREGNQPKTSMLPELASVLDVSVEELLGIKAAAISSQMNNSATVEPSEELPKVRKIREEVTGDSKFGIYEINGEPFAVSPINTRWWEPLLQRACVTVVEGNQEDINDALEQLRLIVKMLEHAQSGT